MATVTSLGFNIFSKYDGTGVRRAKRDVNDLQRSIPKRPLTIRVDANVKEAQEKLDRIEKKINGLRGKTSTINVNANISRASTDIDRISAKLRKLGQESASIEISVRTAGVDKDLDQIGAKLRRLGGKTATINVKVNSGKAMADLDRIAAKVRSLGKMSPKINVTLNAGKAKAEIEVVRSKLRSLGKVTARPNVKLDSGGARRDADGMIARLRLLGSMTARPNVELRGQKAALGEILSLKLALMALGPAGSVSFAAIAGGAIALTGGLGLAAAGLGILGAGMYPLAAQFKHVWESGSAAFVGLSGHELEAAKKFDQLHDAITHVGGALYGPAMQTAFNGVAHGFNILIKLINAMKPAFAPVAKVFSDFMTSLDRAASGPAMKKFSQWFSVTAPAAVKAFLNSLRNVGAGIVNIFKAFAGAGAMNGMLLWIQKVTAGFKKWTEGPGLKTFVAYVTKWGPVVAQVFGLVLKVIGNVGKALGPLGGATLTALVPLLKFLNFIATKCPVVIQIIWLMVMAYKAVMIAQAAWNGVMAITDALMNANPVMLVVLALIALAAALVYAYKHSATFRAIVQAAFNGVKVAGVAMWAGLKIAFNGIVYAARAVGSGIRTAFNGVVSVFRIIGAGITASWRATWNFVRSVFSSAWAHIRATFNAMRGGISTAWRAVCTFVRNLWNSAWGFIRTVFNNAWGHIRATFNAMRGGVSTAWRAVCTFLRNLWNGAWGFIRTVFNNAWGHIRATFNAIRAGVSTAWRAVCNFIRSLWNSAWGFARTVFNNAWGHIRATFNAFRAGVSSAWRAVCNFIRGLWNSAWGFVRSVFNNAWGHIRATFNAIRGTVSSAWRAVCNFLRSAWNSAWGAIRGAFNSAWSHIRATFNTLHNTANHIWTLICNGLKNGWRAAWNFVRAVFSSAWSHIRATFNTLHNFLSHLWTLICNGLKNGWRAAWNFVRAVFSSAWSHIRATFNTLHSTLSHVWTSICNGLRNGWHAAMSAILNTFNWAWGKLRGSIHVMAQTMGSMWRNIVHGTGVIWNGIKAAVGKPINAVIGFVQKLAALADKALGLVGIHKNFAGALNGFKIGGFANGGVFEVNHGVSHSGTVGGYAYGGLLPGYSPGRDNLVASSPIGPVGLSGGEGILRPEVMRVPGMKQFLYTANRAARSGGIAGAKAVAGANRGPKHGEDTFKAFGVRPEFQNPNGGFANGGIVAGFAKGGILPDPGDIVGGIKKAVNVASVLIPGVGSIKMAKDTFEKTAFDMIVEKALGKKFEAMIGKFGGAFGTVTAGMARTVWQAIVNYVTDKTTPKSADGDPTYKNPSKRLQHALSWAQAQQGKPYQWGGGGNPSWDCSGFMAAIQNVINTGNPGGRLYTTMDFRGKSAPSGWVKDLASPFMVGVTNAGVGHMAGTLINHHVESSGSQGVGVDHGHRGAFDKLFKDHYGYKPVVHDATLVSGGGKGGPMSGTIGNGSQSAFVGTFWDTGSSGYGDTGAPASGKSMHKFAMASRNMIPYGKTAIMQAYGQNRMAAFESIDYGPGITSRLFDIDTYGAAWLFGKEGQWSSSNPGRDVSPGVFRVHWKKGYGKGGAAPAGKVALAGENGPEVMVPGSGGTRVFSSGTKVAVGDTNVIFKDKVYVKTEAEFRKMVVTAVDEAKRKKQI